MVKSTGRLPGSRAFGRLLSDVRGAELPDARLWVLYPIGGIAVAAVIVFHLVHGAHHASPTAAGVPPAAHASTTTAPAGQAPPAARSTLQLPTEQGTTLEVPRAAATAIYAAAGLTVGAPSSDVVVVSHLPSGRGITCAVTRVNADGQTVQRLVTVIEGSNGSWTASNAQG